MKRSKRRNWPTAIGDDDRTPKGCVTNPAPGLEVQFADRDRLHVQIVMHVCQPEPSSPLSPFLLRPSIKADPAAARRRIAANGREALAAFNSREFDVVLMDVQMPDIDGFEVTARIRAREAERGGHVPIIAMTAHAMKGDRERCLASGMDDYLCKPLDANLLLALIDSLKESRTLVSIPLAVSPVLKS